MCIKQKRSSATTEITRFVLINHIVLTIHCRLMGYILSLTSSMSLASVNFAQLTPKAAALCETTRNDGHWAVQGHSRSPISVPTESTVYDLLLVNLQTHILSRTVSKLLRHISQIIAFDREMPLFNSLFGANPERWTAKFGLKTITLWCGAQNISIYSTV